MSLKENDGYTKEQLIRLCRAHWKAYKRSKHEKPWENYHFKKYAQTFDDQIGLRTPKIKVKLHFI